MMDIVNVGGFADRDLKGQDQWVAFTPLFGSLTVIGATTYLGRMRIVGKSVECQVSFKAATSIASVAGTDYLTLPITAQGYAGIGVMTHDTSDVAGGRCHLDVTTSRLYLPTQVASANTFTLYFTYEI
mgnify:CR=1 FL=1